MLSSTPKCLKSDEGPPTRPLRANTVPCAGQFGFQKDMHALDSLSDPSHRDEGGLSDVDVLLGATQEIEHRMQGPQRAWQIWRKDLWSGAYLLKRYNVRTHLDPPALSPPRVSTVVEPIV